MAEPIPQLPMPIDGPGSLDYWRNQVTAAQKMIHDLAEVRQWDANITSYLTKGLRSKPIRDTVVVNKDYSLVEGKKALLFFQTPEVAATHQAPEYEQAAPLVAAVVSEYLQRINVKSTVDEILMDVLCPAGIGCAVIGYEAFVDPQMPEQMTPDMMNPTMPQLGPDGQPVMVPNIVRERYFWERHSPKRLLIPASFIGSDFDKASFLGVTFDLDKIVAERLYDLTPEQTRDASAPPDQERTLLQSDVSRQTRQEQSDKITVTQVWYRASDVDPAIGDPEIIRELVYIDGLDTPMVHRDSPFQTISDGRLVNGMKGFPIHPLTLRYVSDQAIPPSDCTISRQAVDELSLGRTQMVQQRDRALPLVLADATRLGDSAEKIARGEIQEIIMVPGMDNSNPPMIPITRGQWPRENFAFNDIINRDIAELWALGANQSGVETDTRRTATELSIMQSATDTRMDAERARVLRWFGRGCEKLLALIQKFADDESYARIVGPNGLPVLQAWDKHAIAGEFCITLAPDSSQRIDAAADKKRSVDIFSMLGNDPLINQVELRKWLVRKMGMDAEKLVTPPPPKPPEPPQISVSLKGEDLAPNLPQYVNVASLLSARGVGMAPPPGVEAGPPPPGAPPVNPGGIPPVTPINKRFDETATEQLPGAGQAPMANI